MNREQLKKLERDLWAAADKLRANSDLKAIDRAQVASECHLASSTFAED